jgi:MarR family 2-MHQ and catechol resistance regulon transcriptional repressor
MPDLSSQLEDPLAHRALEALVRAGASVTRPLTAELERRGLSSSAFSMLVVLVTAGGMLELRTLRLRLGISKASASEVAAALGERGLVRRQRSDRDRRAVTLIATPAGEHLLDEMFPGHARRVRDAFIPLDDEEKRALTRLCRKLAA